MTQDELNEGEVYVKLTQDGLNEGEVYVKLTQDELNEEGSLCQVDTGWVK